MIVWSAQNMPQDGSSFMWHQPYNNQIVLKYTISVAIQNALCLTIQSHMQLECSECVQRQRLALHENDQLSL